MSREDSYSVRTRSDVCMWLVETRIIVLQSVEVLHLYPYRLGVELGRHTVYPMNLLSALMIVT